jgi:hypothetical protein
MGLLMEVQLKKTDLDFPVLLYNIPGMARNLLMANVSGGWYRYLYIDRT